MDEPLSNLDAKLRGNMRAELKHMQSELGITTIYVTHDQIEAMTLANRVAIMKDGVIQQIGTPKEVYSDPVNLFVAGFMGLPPMNFINGTITSGKFLTSDAEIDASGIPDTKQATFGFRPEDCKVVAAGKGLIDANVYTVEMTGDQVLVTFDLRGGHLVVKMPKDFEIATGISAGITLDKNQAYFFDSEHGPRLHANQI